MNFSTEQIVYMPIARFADALAVAFPGGGGPVAVADVLVEAGEAMLQLGQPQVEDHVVQGQLYGFRHGGQLGLAVEAAEFFGEGFDVLMGEVVDPGVGQNQSGMGPEAVGAQVLSVGPGQQLAEFGADVGVGGRLAAVPVYKRQAGGGVRVGQQVTDAYGNEASGIAVHVVDAAFLLFQLAHQSGGESGGGGVHRWRFLFL